MKSVSFYWNRVTAANAIKDICEENYSGWGEYLRLWNMFQSDITLHRVVRDPLRQALGIESH